MSKYYTIGIIWIVISALLGISIFRHNVESSILMAVVGVIVTFFAVFETKSVIVEKVVLIALMSSVAAAGRVAFAGVPNVQPASFIIIVTGIVFGGEIGFITGATTALVSNLLLGHGPWTVWQMFGWGMMGAVSGALSKILSKSRLLLIIFCLSWGFVFGWIMDGWIIVGNYFGGINGTTILAIFASSFLFDLTHGVANAVLALIFGRSFIKIFNRISVKYGLKKL